MRGSTATEGTAAAVRFYRVIRLETTGCNHGTRTVEEVFRGNAALAEICTQQLLRVCKSFGF